MHRRRTSLLCSRAARCRARHPRAVGRGSCDPACRRLPAEDHLPVTDRDRDALRDRRGQAGHRGRRPVELPGARPDDRPLRLHAERRGDRGVRPRPRGAARRPSEEPAGGPRHQDPRAARSREARRLLRADRASSGRSPATRRRRTGSSPRCAPTSRTCRPRFPTTGSGRPRTTSSTTPTSPLTRPRSSGGSCRRAGFDNIADGAKAESPGYPQLSSEAIVDDDPDLVFLADTKCCAQSPETFGEPARVRGARPRSRTATS